jgi:sialidase-1
VRLVLRVSDDSGKTWSAIRTVHVEAGHTIGNPAPVADNVTGDVHLLFSRDNKEVFSSVSADDGLSWAAPLNRTDTLKPTKQHDLWVATGPPGGIQLASGRLITAAYYNPPDGRTASYAIFSDDHGQTWKRGADVGYGDSAKLGESQIAAVNEGPNKGKLAMFIRAIAADLNYTEAHHAIAISGDEGQTWEIPARMIDEGGAFCLGSVVSGYYGLWLAAPSDFTDYSARKGMRVAFASVYGRRTWREMNLWDGPAAYSSMVLSGIEYHPRSNTPEFFILFERGLKSPYEHLTFANSVPSYPHDAETILM